MIYHSASSTQKLSEAQIMGREKVAHPLLEKILFIYLSSAIPTLTSLSLEPYVCHSKIMFKSILVHQVKVLKGESRVRNATTKSGVGGVGESTV